MILFWQLLTGSGVYLAVEKCLRNCGKCREETEKMGGKTRWYFQDGACCFGRYCLLYMFCRVQGCIGLGNKVEANRLKNKTQKTCLAFEYALLVSHLPYFLLCCGCGCFLRGGGERGVVFFGLKSCEKDMLLRKKQSFVNSVIEILLIINSNFTLLLK